MSGQRPLPFGSVWEQVCRRLIAERLVRALEVVKVKVDSLYPDLQTGPQRQSVRGGTLSPKYAGNLDIMTLAALRTAECLVGTRVN